MTRTDGSTSASDVAEAKLAAFLEKYHEVGGDPEVELFAAHPEHAARLRRWWARLVATGAVHRCAPAGERFGPFVLLRPLGQGAQGAVHLAEDTRLGRTVALKILPTHRLGREQAKGRFRREAEMASRLQHPSICTVFESGEHDGTAFIAMQHVEGSTLAEHITKARATAAPLPIDFVLRIIEQTARALQVAHDAGLVHRDIKPGNLMVAANDHPVVLDFGLARDNGPSDLTQSGDLIGTPSYMSPEQLHGGRFPVDGRTDVYSLGVTMFECLTSRRPFEEPTQQALMQRILAAAAPDPRRWRPELSRDVSIVLATALAKDREHRYASAAAFAEDLRRLRLREPLLARPIGPLNRLWRWSRSHAALAASLAVAAASLLLGIAASLWLYFAATAAHAAFVSLADIELLREIEREAQQLPPTAPENASTLDDWLRRRARPLASRLQQHRNELQALQRRAQPNEHDATDPESIDEARRLEDMREREDELRRALDTDSRNGSAQVRVITQARLTRIEREIKSAEAALARPRFVFADPELAFRHRHLETLVERLEDFVRADGTLATAEARLAWSHEMLRTTVLERAQEWQRAAAEVAADPRHGERHLPRQAGFVPLGPDPQSGCQEFAFAYGGEVPRRDPSNRQLLLSATSAPVFVLIPAGTLRPVSMRPGSSGESDSNRSVDLNWYFIGKHELTRAQWRRLGGGNPSLLQDDLLGVEPDMHPVAGVNWSEARTVLSRHGLSLPTEAHWEFAARGGAATQFWTGDDTASLRAAANFRDADDGYLLTAPVNALPANGFGLHHVAGNVAEWCRELQPRAGRSETSASVGRNRPVRGGSFAAAAAQGRAGTRYTRNGDLHYPQIGVRAARFVTDH